jgi:ATP-dependent helicase/nuclease subunit B
MTNPGAGPVSGPIAAFDFPPDHPAVTVWCDPVHGFFQRLRAHLTQRGAHPGRTVVLLPYAQLRPLAARLWAQLYPQGFAPRFETTQSWAAVLGAARPGPLDIRFDLGLDGLTAQALLARAGLAEYANALRGTLVAAAQTLAPMAAAQPPAGRTVWAAQARHRLALDALAGGAMHLEAASARIAIEWVAASGYASDALFAPDLLAGTDALVLAHGLLPDPLAEGLRAVWGEALLALPLVERPQPLADAPMPAPPPAVLRACSDAEDEAQYAAACAIAHIEAGRYPLAVVSSDRALTRRLRALLDGAGVAIRDETGWKLSTTLAAGQLMAALRACHWSASSDTVLAWLKLAPRWQATTDVLEAALRTDAVRDWAGAAHSQAVQADSGLLALCSQVNALRDRMAGRVSVSQWLLRLRQLLDDAGLLEPLQADAAGAQMLSALRLTEADGAAFDALAADALWGARRMDLSEFTQWVNEVLEASNFQPSHPLREEVVFLPLSQMLARPFAALVLAGCDEQRLNPSPEPVGLWTPAQRAALGLPTREATEHATRAAWAQALRTPAVDVLWRTADEAGETLLPSTLVRLLQVQQVAQVQLAQEDPRVLRTLAHQPVPRPMPQGDALPLREWTQGAYADLRHCPYRFFALRQLGLRAAPELEVEVDKRDFGLWLHEVLQRFHTRVGDTAGHDDAVLRLALDQAAQASTEAMALPAEEFLPFDAAWPKLREGYLRWLRAHTGQGLRFQSGETEHRLPLGDLVLYGRVDRIDSAPDGSRLLLDYKTESLEVSKKRTKEPLEDTQIAFYAALLPDDTLRGGYLNLSDREEGTKLVEQTELVAARDALIEGLQQDWARIAQGAPLPALGEAGACTYCDARGLCRKDFWGTP